jgi:hypothetical protein
VAAAIEHDRTIAVGDAVFIQPHGDTPDHLRGIHGTVLAVEGAEAQLRQHPSDELLRVEIGLLRRDRRRPRVRTDWETAS